MKYYLQVKNTNTNPAEIYKFVYTVDTKAGLEKYQIQVPPTDGYKYNAVTKVFDKLSAADKGTAYTSFSADQTKSVFLQKWRVITGWAVAESPADDGFPPFPGPI